jgi:hypothetical protein
MNLTFGEPHMVEVIEVRYWGVDGCIVQEVYECGHGITYHESAFTPEWCAHHGYTEDDITRRCWQCACTVVPERKSKSRKPKTIVSVQIKQLELWA